MKQIVGFTVFFLTIVLLPCCNKTGLSNRVTVTKEVSVLLPQNIDKKEVKGGSVHYQTRIGSSEIFVSALMDVKIEKNNLNEIKNNMGINIDRYIKTLNARILMRKDTIINNIVQSDFEYEIIDSESSIFGVGRFIVKDTDFISFCFQTIKPESKSDVATRESFFKSIILN